MTSPDPIPEDVQHIPYGQNTGIELVETYGFYEAEYAAIRKGLAVFEAAHRGTVELRGGDRLTFLHRFLTNPTNNLKPGQARRAFLLNTKARIRAELIVIELGDRCLLELDATLADELTRALNDYLFAEDLTVTNLTAQSAWVWLQGPGIASLGELPAMMHAAPLLGAQALRYDTTGGPGLLLHTTRPHAAELMKLPQAKPIGWAAYNTARIEAGTPLFLVDYGTDSMPHETGLVAQTVDFKKGCYVGQEIVARTQHLGHPSKVVAMLTLDGDALPMAGSQVLAEDGSVVGAVTSSTLSPLRGNQASLLAMVKWGLHEPGTTLRVPAEGAIHEATVADKPIVPPRG